jgi:prepilin-type N-terminal cleavage/methylation domain-containing protein
MRLGSSHSRRGFTLLEVLLAATIGVLLMAALYVAVDVQVRHAQAGREIVEQSKVGRALLARITADITPCIGQVDPSRYNGNASSSSSPGGSSTTITATGTTSTTTTSGNNTTSSSTSSTSSTTTTSASGSSTSTNSSTPSTNFYFTVQGDSASLTLFVSRVPAEVLQTPGTTAANSADNLPIVSDVRRIAYWLANDSSGLCRQELKLATSDDTSTMPPNIPDEASWILAPEVKTLSFSYFDGTNWQDSWDGTQPGPDGVTPIGAPLGIAITIGIAPPGATGSDSSAKLRTFRHVVAIPTANFVSAQTTTTTP